MKVVRRVSVLHSSLFGKITGSKMTDEQRNTKSLLALTPVVLTLNPRHPDILLHVFEPHIPLAIGIALTSFVGTYLGLTWEEVGGIFKVIHVACRR